MGSLGLWTPEGPIACARPAPNLTWLLTLAPGCRCPPGQLVQDGHCVPVSSCHCGPPSPNASWVLAPLRWCSWTAKTGRLAITGQAGEWGALGEAWGRSGLWALLGCTGSAHPDSGLEPFLYNPVHSTCVNGSVVCPRHECPVLGPWSAGSSCSVPCGGGITERHRSCKEVPGGHHARSRTWSSSKNVTHSLAQVSTKGSGCLPFPPGCRAQPHPSWHPSGQWEGLRQPPPRTAPCCLCAPPEGPPGQVLRVCATSCPRLCSPLQPGALGVQNPGQLGCGCPGEQVGVVAGPDSQVGEQGGRGAGRGWSECNWSLCCPSCCTMARVCPPPCAHAPSSPCCGASP